VHFFVVVLLTVRRRRDRVSISVSGWRIAILSPREEPHG
jgi:hypothetical protein